MHTTLNLIALSLLLCETHYPTQIALLFRGIPIVCAACVILARAVCVCVCVCVCNFSVSYVCFTSMCVTLACAVCVIFIFRSFSRRDCEQVAKFTAFKESAKCVALDPDHLPSVCCYTLLNTYQEWVTHTHTHTHSHIHKTTVCTIWRKTHRHTYTATATCA